MKLMCFVWFAALCVVLLLFPSGAAALPEREVEAALEGLAQSGFVGDLAVECEGRVLRRRWGGEEGPSALGSTTKQFAAAAILVLEQRGRLRLGQPIADFFPEVDAESLAFEGTPIAVVHLLSHTSGLPAGMPRFFDPLLQNHPDVVDYLSSFEAIRAPGSQFAYSNIGYELLGEIVRRIDGRPFARFVEQELFAPAGMEDSYGASSEIDSLRAGTLLSPLGPIAVTWGLPDWMGGIPRALSGASIAVASTADDLLKWLTVLERGTLITPESRARMWTAGTDDYGFGWNIEHSIDGGQWVWHAGVLTPGGYQSFIAMTPKCKIAVTSTVDLSSLPIAPALVAVARGSSPPKQEAALSMFLVFVPLHAGHWGLLALLLGGSWMALRMRSAPAERLCIWGVNAGSLGAVFASFESSRLALVGLTAFVAVAVLVVVTLSRRQLKDGRSAAVALWQEHRNAVVQAAFVMVMIAGAVALHVFLLSR